MSYLVRFDRGRPHHIAHRLHEVQGVAGALCSQIPTPAVGQTSRSGRWEVLEMLPEEVRICHVCAKIQQKLENPLPARAEEELRRLALWDPAAAERQRQRLLAYYREKMRPKRK